MRGNEGWKMIGVVAIVIIAIMAFVAINPLTKIGAGERGVVLSWGAVEDIILGEGIHWITPVKQDVETIDVTVKKEEKTSTASSRDLQVVTTKVAINWHPDPLKVNKLYQEYRKEISVRVIGPAIDEFVKKTTALYTAEELVTKRESVKTDLKQSLIASLSNRYVIVDDIFMTDFQFSKVFNDAIEAKVTAEQKALEAKNKLEEVKYNAQQQIVSAEAQAKAIQIQAQAITQQGGREYVNLKAVEKWDGKLPTQMIPNATLPFLNLNK